MLTRRGIAKLAALVIATVVACLCVEVLVRVSGMDSPLVWRPDPVLGWWHIPHARMHWRSEGDGLVEINGVGLRDVDRAIAKPRGVFRIAVFGDSMTEAVQVNLDQTFTQHLERSLNARGVRVEVLNFGVNGYSPLQGYLLYQRVGKDFTPDLVLHAVFLDNDIADLDPKLSSADRLGPLVSPDSSAVLSVDYSRAEASHRDYSREPVHTVRRLSASYRLASARRWQLIGRRAAVAPRTEGGGTPKRFLLYAEPPLPSWEAAWSAFAKVEDAFAAEVRAAGSVFAIVSVPAGQGVYPRAWSQILKDYPAMESGRWDLLGPEDRLSRIASSRDMVLLTPMEDFRSHGGEAPLFFGLAGHLTPHGHEVMAASLFQSLVARGLVPAASGG